MICSHYPYLNNCNYQNSIYSSTSIQTTTQTTVHARHLNFLQQHIIGTSFWDAAGSIILIVIVAAVVYRLILQPLTAAIANILNFRKAKETKAVFLEITPPAHIDKSSLATQQLFHTIKEVIGPRGILSLEVVGSYEEGTRYVVRTRAADVEVLQQQLASYVNDAHFRILEDPYRPEAVGTSSSCYNLFELKQAIHYGFPLQEQADYAQHDLSDYITGAMTKLEPGEAILLQTVIRQHSSFWTKLLHDKIQRDGYAPLDHRLQSFVLNRRWIWVISGLFGLITNDLKAGLSLAIIGLIVYPFIPKKRAELHPEYQRIFKQILEKLSKPLFKADIRILVIGSNGQRTDTMTRSICASLVSLNVPGYQQLIVRRTYPFSFYNKFSMYKFENRLPSLLAINSNILTSAELADIYHFPYGDSRTENLIRSHSRTLPAPLAIKKRSENNGFILYINSV
jgi:hypothetical protein